MYKDMTYLMCGSAVHLATQIGLHISGVGQDFARAPVKKDQEQKVFRARLWLCCVIVSIRYEESDTMLSKILTSSGQVALKVYHP